MTTLAGELHRAHSILTRSSGYLRGVSSHSLQPYRGCSYGRSLCGVACYVRHNRFLTRGRAWGSFLEAKQDAARLYLEQAPRERRWSRGRGDAFSIFMSSATDPFVPQERRLGITRSILEAMLDEGPDELILQTHSHHIADYADLLVALDRTRTALRAHISIECDRERLPGLPPPASSLASRIDAAAQLRGRGLRVVATVAPLLPVADPEHFFTLLGECSDAVVIDHFIGGDGSAAGSRTRRTALPAAMAALEPASTSLAYRDRMVAIACEILPGRVGVGRDGFAGRMLPV